MIAPTIRKFWVATMLLVCPAASLACQGHEEDFDVRRHTNIGMPERADLVVFGRVDPPRPIDAPFSFEIGLTPIRTLKGQAPKNLTLYGTVRDPKGELVQPSPTGLHGEHPSSSWGSCDRAAYAPGSLVLAAFVKRPMGYIQLNGRGVEDVEGPDGLWVRAALLYTTIIRKNPSSRRRQAFQKESERLLAKKGDPDAHAIAKDIAGYLRATGKK